MARLAPSKFPLSPAVVALCARGGGSLHAQPSPRADGPGRPV